MEVAGSDNLIFYNQIDGTFSIVNIASLTRICLVNDINTIKILDFYIDKINMKFVVSSRKSHWFSLYSYSKTSCSLIFTNVVADSTLIPELSGAVFDKNRLFLLVDGRKYAYYYSDYPNTNSLSIRTKI